MRNIRFIAAFLLLIAGGTALATVRHSVHRVVNHANRRYVPARKKQQAHHKAAVRHKAPVHYAQQPIPKKVEFLRDIAPILARSGCSGAQCHGKFGGRGGFEVSLLTLSPEDDYAPLVYGDRGRRINFADPARSLLLLKATGQISHGGGERFSVHSRRYKLLLRWIEEGAPFHKTDPRLKTLVMSPSQYELKHTGQHLQVHAIATFTNGKRLDVTHETVFMTSNPTVFNVSDNGLVTGTRWGGGAIMGRYLGVVASSDVTLPESRKGGYPKIPDNNLIDRYVFANLRYLNVVPSGLSGDTEFLRRVMLDTVGQLPTPGQIARFTADTNPNKRSILIDKLLQEPGFVDLRTLRLADLMRVNPNKLPGSAYDLRERSAELFYEWIHEQVRKDTPWNQFVYKIITAQGSTYQYGPTCFYQVEQAANDRAEDVGEAFLGVRLACARCHKHPFDRWTTDDYWNFSAFFQKVGEQNGKLLDEAVLTYNPGAALINQSVLGPNRGQVAPPTFLGAGAPAPDKGNQIVELADWMTAPNNPFFARAAMNRLWSYYFGMGIVNPVDDMRTTVPPSVPGLLSALSKEFIASGYNVRHMIRLILNSRTYQLTSIPNASNALDEEYFSHFVPHAMPAQVLMDMVDQATGSRQQFGAFPDRSKAIQASFPIQNPFVTAFGESHREFLTDLDPNLDPNLMQCLTMINSPYILNKVNYGSTLRQALATTTTPEDLVKFCYLYTFSRPPTPTETSRCMAILQQAKNRQNGAQDLLWALIASREFYFNH